MSKIFSALLIVVAMLATTMVSATPASAMTSGQCPASTFCTWNGKDFSGSPAWSQNVGGLGACYNISAINGANNNAESVYNRESFSVTVYSGSGGSGFMFTLAAGSGISDLSHFPNGGGYQNIASSICHG